MARRAPKILWTTNTLTPALAAFTVKANMAIRAGAVACAEDLEQWMKNNAPWEDRTGDARAGLTAEAHHQGFRQEILIYHTAEYGVWLEVRWNGRYAIIQPALDHFSTVGMRTHFGTEIMAAGAV